MITSQSRKGRAKVLFPPAVLLKTAPIMPHNRRSRWDGLFLPSNHLPAFRLQLYMLPFAESVCYPLCWENTHKCSLPASPPFPISSKEWFLPPYFMFITHCLSSLHHHIFDPLYPSRTILPLWQTSYCLWCLWACLLLFGHLLFFVLYFFPFPSEVPTS